MAEPPAHADSGEMPSGWFGDQPQLSIHLLEDSWAGAKRRVPVGHVDVGNALPCRGPSNRSNNSAISTRRTELRGSRATVTMARPGFADVQLTTLNSACMAGGMSIRLQKQ